MCIWVIGVGFLVAQNALRIMGNISHLLKSTSAIVNIQLHSVRHIDLQVEHGEIVDSYIDCAVCLGSFTAN